MKKTVLFLLLVITTRLIMAETLFEVKDSDNHKVLDVSSDGLRIYNYNGVTLDTLMAITSSKIKAFIDQDATKALSRSFSVTSTSSGKGGNDVFSITKSATRMWEGTDGYQYTDFSPDNIFLGLNAGIGTTGNCNVFIGNSTGISNISGGYNTFVGTEAGQSNSDKHSNTFVGHQAGALSNGDCNTFMGYRSGYGNTSGMYNSFYGQYSGNNIGTGSGNCAFGFQAAASVKDGQGNTIMGYDAGHGSSSNTFNYNCLFGGYAGSYLYTGSNNVMMGYMSGYNNQTGTGNVFVGYKTGYNELGSNKLYIDNSNISTPLIYGDFSTNALTINGTLTTTGNTSVGGTLTTSNDAIINGDAHIINSANVSGAKGLVIDTDGDTTDYPLRIRTTSTATGWTDADTKFLVYGDGEVEAKSLQLDGGTEIKKTQAGILTVGTNSSSTYKAVTLTFPSAFAAVPKINVTPVNESGINDIYSATVRNITTTNCVVLFCRVDSTVKTWGQNLKADWFAWE